MFQKHTTTTATNEQYEKTDGTVFYRIYEVENGRYINSDMYALYFDWIAAGNVPEVIDVTPVVIPPIVDLNPSTEERLTAVEQYLVEQLLG
jgi:hypothetical protein